ncbi:unnamed protein product [Paramecium octaurelia]|uniref:Uncharacterized protein n=1 Tax=Paramecium octaurelia TaxID=43137 RepID=A0A8S1V791_PAROT|nr:unnamed protein product [Paramecium octaurelia]
MFLKRPDKISIKNGCLQTKGKSLNLGFGDTMLFLKLRLLIRPGQEFDPLQMNLLSMEV